MRGWRTLVSKDWKLVYRNRLLLAVLILYPFLIMGVIGAAFQESGRPVPVGVVNLDKREGTEILWWVLESRYPKNLERQVRWEADRTSGYGSREEALADLEAGGADLILMVKEPEKEAYWSGARVSGEVMERLMDDLENLSDEVRFFGSAEEALAGFQEMESGLLVGVSADRCPCLGETLWIEGENYDAARLLRNFSRDVVEMEDYRDEREARTALQEGRIDAAIVIPPGFIRRLKMLEKAADVEVIIDQSSMVKAEFAETSIRGFLSRVSERVVEEKMRAVVAGLRVLVDGGDFFGTQVVGLSRIRDDLAGIRDELAARPELREKVDEGIRLADTVIGDIEEAADYLRGTALPVNLRITSVAGKPLAARDAVVPSLIALSMLWTGVLCGAILMVLEDEEGMRVRLRLTSMGPLALIGSKLILAACIVFVQSSVMLLLAVAAFRTFASNLFLALATIAVASLSCIGLGLVLAAFARQVAGAVILSVLVSFPLIFITGMVFPLNLMPSFMRVIARAVPLTYAVEALSGVMLRGEGVAGVAGDWLVLLGFGAFFLAIGSLLVRGKST